MPYLTTSMIRPLVKAVCDLAYVLKGNGKPSDEPMDYEVIAELFYGLYGDEAIEKIEQVLEKAGAVEKAWNASDHPRGKNGRFIPKGSAEAVSSAEDAVRKVLKGDYSVKPQEIADHLSILTMKQIRALAAEHGRKVPKVLKADLIESVKALVGQPAADAATTPDAKGGEVSDKGGSVEQVSDKPKDAPAASTPPAKPDPVINREVDEILNSHTQWHSDYALPKKTASRLVDDILRRGGNRYVYARTITDQGWATEGHYVVRATPKMIEYAQSKGVQDLPGYVPNVNDILPKKRGEHASIVGGRKDEYGDNVLLFQADNNRQMVADSEYVSAVTSLYPKADWELQDTGMLIARQDGEIVGLVMGMGDVVKPSDRHYAEVKGKRRTLADRMQPGPYSSTDVMDEGGRFVVGRGTPDELAVRITGSAKAGYSLAGGNVAFPAYETVSEAKNAAKEILSYVHGKDDDGTFIFKPRDESDPHTESNSVARESSLSPEAKRHRDYYANLREKAKGKPVRKEKIELEDDKGNKYERELAYVGDHFAVHEALPKWKRGKPRDGGYSVRLTGSNNAVAATFKNKTDAVKFAHILEAMPDMDWSLNFPELKEKDPERSKQMSKRFQSVLRAFENNEYHPDMGDPDMGDPERLK